MHLSRCLFVLSLLATALSAQVPKEHQGYWFRINEMSYIHLTSDTVREMPGGASGSVKVFDKERGMLVWEDQSGRRVALFSEGELLVKNMAPNPPAWTTLLKYSRTPAKVAEETRKAVDALAKSAPASGATAGQSALQAPAAKAAANIDRRAIEVKMRENLMRLDAAAGMYLLENGVDKVSFARLKASPSMPGDFAAVDGEDYSKLEFGKGVTVHKVTSQNGVTASITP